MREWGKGSVIEEFPHLTWERFFAHLSLLFLWHYSKYLRPCVSFFSHFHLLSLSLVTLLLSLFISNYIFIFHSPPFYRNKEVNLPSCWVRTGSNASRFIYIQSFNFFNNLFDWRKNCCELCVCRNILLQKKGKTRDKEEKAVVPWCTGRPKSIVFYYYYARTIIKQG